MDCFFKKIKEESPELAFDDQQHIQTCPFLKNINKPTNFTLMSMDLSNSVSSSYTQDHSPLAATISLSGFGSGGPFSFDAFYNKWKKQNKNKDHSSHSQGEGGSGWHEALGNEWLKDGNCPIAKSYRAVSRALPLVAKAVQPPPGATFRCPPAIVAARAALSKSRLARDLRPQPLGTKMVAVAALSMAVNLPLGVWREHTDKFSPCWFVAVHAAVPLLAMLRKAVLMPKSAVALTIAASILGQAVGARVERIRMKAVDNKKKRIVLGKDEIVGVVRQGKGDGSSSSNASVCFSSVEI